MFGDDPKLVLDKSLYEISDCLEVELCDRIESGGVPLVGIGFDGVSDDGTPVRLEVRLMVRSDKE